MIYTYASFVISGLLVVLFSIVINGLPNSGCLFLIGIIMGLVGGILFGIEETS